MSYLRRLGYTEYIKNLNYNPFASQIQMVFIIILCFYVSFIIWIEVVLEML